MAIIASEQIGFETMSGRSPYGAATWRVTGTTDEATARAVILGEAPTDIEGLLRDELRMKEEGGGIWTGTLTYRLGDRITTNDPTLGGTGSPNSNDSHEPAGTAGENPIPPEFSMEIGGRSLKITQSIETVEKIKRSDAEEGVEPPDLNGAIGVSRGPSGVVVEGCEIDVTETTWTETWIFPRANCTYAYVWSLEAMANTVNDDDFRGGSAGEVRFLGASIQSHGLDQVKITFRFKRSKNVEFNSVLNPIAPFFNTVTKGGHNYVWFTYRQKVDENALGAEPEFCYVERVYEESDFILLGIGR